MATENARAQPTTTKASRSEKLNKDIGRISAPYVFLSNRVQRKVEYADQMSNQGDTKPNKGFNSGPQTTRPSSASGSRLVSRPVKPGYSAPPAKGGGRLRRFLRSPIAVVVLTVFIALLLVSAASGAAGWSVGRSEFNATATMQASFYMLEQYNLAIADMEAGSYELARQRLEYIFSQDPEFLDVADLWIEVMLVIGNTPQSTSVELPTESPTPTQDPRPKEELLVAARARMVAHDWTEAIDTLLALRQADAGFNTADVDGMLFAALRNRGAQNIVEFGLFEPGLYDFALAEKFGPLDGLASNYREWARLYLYGNAFWLAYPQDAAYYYGLLVGMAPDLRDSNGIAAFTRYWQSLVHIGDQLGAEGDWCAAADAYQDALNVRIDAELQAKLNFAFEACIGPTDLPTSTLPFTLTPTWTVVPPTASDTPLFDTETPTDTSPAPSDTPVPSDTPEPPSETPTETPTP